MSEWKLNRKQTAFEGPYVKVEEWFLQTPLGKEIHPLMVIANQAVFVFPITEDNKVVVLKEFFVSDMSYHYTVVAGSMDREGSPLEIARAELLEEAGALTDELIPLGKITSRKWDVHIDHFFLAKNVQLQKQDLQGHEDIAVEVVSLERFKEILRNGEMHDSFWYCVCLQSS
jgi:ADP-ribose pyrophosphatase